MSKKQALVVGLSTTGIFLSLLGVYLDGHYLLHGFVIFCGTMTIYYTITDYPKKPN